MAIQTNTTGVVLEREEASLIIQKAREDSVFMQLGQKEILPYGGLDYQVITGEPTAHFTNEGARAKASSATFDMLKMSPHKMTCVFSITREAARNKRSLFDALLNKLPKAFAEEFDANVIATTTSLGDFAVMGDCQASKITTDTYKGLTNAEYLLGDELFVADKIALSPAGKRYVRDCVDNNGRPIFATWDQRNGTAPYSLLDYPCHINRNIHRKTVGQPEVLGVMGDWSHYRYGVNEQFEITFDPGAIITHEDGTEENCFQEGKIGVRAELITGSFISKKKAFVLLTGDNVTASNEGATPAPKDDKKK